MEPLATNGLSRWEKVVYTYNRAGNLHSMEGTKEGRKYPYIKQLGYNAFEQRQYIKYGNDTETNHKYEPTMHRLQQMSLHSSTREVMNNQYSYDLVGNITTVKNNAAVVNNSLGGSSLQEYTYDSFYRLATAKGSYKGEFVEANYQLGMRYNSLHGIEQKELLHTVNQQQKGYVLDYSYKDAAHPHAVSAVMEAGKPVERAYSYDGNGNPLNYTEDQSFRKFSWDEENRLMGINDNGELHQYTYDHSGERVIKSKSDAQKVSVNGQASASLTHSDGYTGYVSPYFVISKGKFTKHYFDGASRVVSKLGNGVFRQPIGITAGGVNYTKLTEAQQKALDEYIRKLGIPPGPPTQQGIYGTPEYTGMPYPSLPLENVKENQEPPQGWPRNPRFNEKGDVPGPPAQFGPPVSPEKVEAGEGFVGTGLPEQNIYYLHSDHFGQYFVYYSSKWRH
ncbi:MAG: hypothetical protein LBI72_00610 [Flavobacteriaceae bacterium]|nr:hypothetical protein [Flavobacteriaceae bacterium]